MTQIQFTDSARDTYIIVLDGLREYTVKVDFRNHKYPSTCVIVSAAADGLTVCKSDETGTPNYNATWLIPYDEILNLTII